MELVDGPDGLESDGRVPVQGYRLALRLCRVVPGFLAAAGCTIADALNRQKAGALAQRPLIRCCQKVDEDLRLARVGGLRRDGRRINCREVASVRQRAREPDAFGDDDLGGLCAADRMLRVAF